MKAFKLLAKLRLLILVGYEDGQLIWTGKNSEWAKVSYEEESILKDWELEHNF